MLVFVTIVFASFLSFANGANDNFKGVGTIFGSKIASFRQSLSWATVTTLAGSALALLLAGELMASFSGKGLVPDTLFQNPVFGLSIAFAAAATVLLASRLGLPVSTTHAITGALVGAGLVGSSEGIHWARLGNLFVLPLLLSPVIATVIALSLQKISNGLTKQQGNAEACVCITEPKVLLSYVTGGYKETAGTEAIAAVSGHANAELISTEKMVILGKTSDTACAESEMRLTSSKIARSLHFLSAGAVSFARGVNDTPKIAALLMTAGALAKSQMIVIVAALMAIGGILYSRRVAETVSQKITTLTESEGLTANLTTSFLVIAASRFGLPVSTTHVSTGALFGIGAGAGKLRWDTLRSILLAWIATLPLAGLISGLAFIILKRIFP